MIRSGWKQDFPPQTSLIFFFLIKTEIWTLHPNPIHSVFNGEDLDDATGKADKSWNFPLDTDKILSKKEVLLNSLKV